MSKEGPQGMNRREFLKTTPAAVGAVAGVGSMEAGAQGQEKKSIDNRIGELLFHDADNKINFPDTFKPINEDVQNLLKDIQQYQNIFLGSNTFSANLQNSASQTIKESGTQKEVDEAKRRLWSQFRKIDPQLGEYHENDFYRVIVVLVPRYLSDYGIYAMPNLLTFTVDDTSGVPISFARVEIGFQPFVIEKVTHDESEQGGVKMKRDFLHISGPLMLDDKPFVNKETTRSAENSNGNIVVFEKNLVLEVNTLTKMLSDLEKSALFPSKGKLLEIKRKELEAKNDWSIAVEVATLQIAEKRKIYPQYEERRKSIIIHETRHLIDFTKTHLKDFWPYIVTSNPAEDRRRGQNYLAHGEINPIISQLRYGENKGHILLELINNTRDVNAQAQGVYSIASKWIARKMVEFISREPEKYGIKIAKSSVGRSNQILSQFDVLLEKSELLNDLCDKVMEEHNKNLGEDILSNLSNSQQLSETSLTRDWTSLYEIGVPVVAVGAGALVYKKLSKRMKGVAAEKKVLAQMTRTEQREFMRKKEKAANKKGR